MRKNKQIDKWLEDWLSIANEKDNNKDHWTEIPGVGMFKNLKQTSNDISDTNITMNFECDNIDIDL